MAAEDALAIACSRLIRASLMAPCHRGLNEELEPLQWPTLASDKKAGSNDGPETAISSPDLAFEFAHSQRYSTAESCPRLKMICELRLQFAVK